jgi:tetratricopeptide (TPR) repeat protein
MGTVNLPLLMFLLAGAFPAGDALERAETLLSAGRPAEARAAVEKALVGEVPAPERALLLEAKGRCLRAEGSPWDAEAAFAEALEARPEFYEAAVGRGEVFLDLSLEASRADRATGSEVRALAADAVRWLGKASTLRAGDPRAGRGLARARILDRDFAGAAAGVRTLLEAAPGDAGLHHLLAEALRGTGDRAGAAGEEAAALSIDPSLAGAAALRVADLAAAGDARGARESAIEALRARPAAEDLYGALWAVDAPEKRWDALEDAFARVLAKHPEQPKALHYLAYTQFSAGRRDAALETFRRKAALEPRNPDPLLQIGRLLVPKGDFAGAEKAFEGALAAGLEPGSAACTAALEGLAAVGGGFGQGRKYADAERVFRRLVEMEPTSAAYRMFLGLSLRRLARYEDAEKTYLEAIVLSPFDGAPRNELGLLYLGWGRTAEARKAFEESAAGDPRITSPVENLAQLAHAEGRLDEALAWFREGHRRGILFRDEVERLKFRRYLDAVTREREAAAAGSPPSGR